MLVATSSPTAAPILSLTRATVGQLEREIAHYVCLIPPLLCSWSYCRQELNPTALSPLIHPFQRTLSQLPSSSLTPSLSPSLRLNGGKGYKVSPQRPIQSTVYSGNPTPAGVSVPASDHYRVAREKGSRGERGAGVGRLLGCLHTPGSECGFLDPMGSQWLSQAGSI